MKFVVVIPYFQRARGILSGALRSIFQQELGPDDQLHVIVVDDGSPVPPIPEMELFPWEGVFSAISVARANGGPAAARNTGLDCLPSQADAVAFLDSDDCWTPGHLRRAKRALESGSDFYFDDHLGVGANLTHFQHLARDVGESIEGLPAALTASVGGDRGVKASSAGDELWEFCPEQAPVTFARAYVAQPSTIVISTRLADQRFEPSLSRAGEDYLYAFELARTSKQVTYSALLGCRQGKGVNLYADAIVRGGPSYLALLRDNVLCMIMMRERARAGSPLDLILKQRIVERGGDLVMFWLRLLLTRGHAPLAPIAAVVRLDSQLLMPALFTALARGLSKIKGLRRISLVPNSSPTSGYQKRRD